VNVPVVAIGARTPVGYQAASSSAAIRCGIRRVQEHPMLADRRGTLIFAGIDEGLDATRFGAIRLLTLARSALKEALAAIATDPSQAPRIDVLLALPEARPGFTDANAHWVAREVTAGLLPNSVELAARGHAGALEALRDAAQRIEAGRSDLCAILGVDSYLALDTIEWLEDNRRLAGEKNRDGFFPGEAAGCVVVASPSAKGTLGLPTLAIVRGAHSARERVLIHGDDEVLGHGLTEAIMGATASLRLPAEAIDDVFCDMNGERYRTDEWGFALLRTSSAFRSVGYQMPASCWGDVGAASGALGCALAIRAWARSYASGPRALVWGSSEQGLRSAVVLEEAGS
jgi:3-oxoacyl-[acyl-carrier-protein] synthase I